MGGDLPEIFLPLGGGEIVSQVQNPHEDTGGDKKKDPQKSRP
jgi:hypothetical protein